MRIPDPLRERVPARVAGTAQLNRVRGFAMGLEYDLEQGARQHASVQIALMALLSFADSSMLSIQLLGKAEFPH